VDARHPTPAVDRPADLQGSSSTTTSAGCPFTVTGVPSGVSLPVVASMVKTVTVEAIWLPAMSYLPVGSKVNSRIQAVPMRCRPTLVGLPVASTEKMAMLLSVRLTA